MNRDSDKAALAHKDAIVEAELEKFMSHVIGRDRFNADADNHFSNSVTGGRRR
jgi:hypothetical protein